MLKITIIQFELIFLISCKTVLMQWSNGNSGFGLSSNGNNGFGSSKFGLPPIQNKGFSSIPNSIQHPNLLSFINNGLSFKDKLSDRITALAGSKSKGECGKYVRQAIQEAKNIKVEGTGVKLSKDLGPWLIQNGFKPTNKSYKEAKTGSIAVLDSVGNHKSGHIQILSNDNKWRSDFTQNGFFPWRDGSKPNYIIYE